MQVSSATRRRRTILKDVPDAVYDRGTERVFTKGRFLGKGGFARCYELIENKTRKVFAGKVVSKLLLTEAHQKEKMYQEVAIHRNLCHPHVVKMEGCFEDEENVYVLLELCTRRSLMELHKRRRFVTEPEARYFIHQIATACIYLHANKIIHRDLKLGNLFIDENMQIKIGDFGLATKLSNDGELKYTLCGTPNYIAPEMLDKKGHSYEVDIWAIGCVLYTLLVGKPPFETDSIKETYARIRNNQFSIPSRIGQNARTLITQLLAPDRLKRPKAAEILGMSFVTFGFMPTRLPTSCLTMTPKLNTNATAVKYEKMAAEAQGERIASSSPSSQTRLKSKVNNDENVRPNENNRSDECEDSLRILFRWLFTLHNSDPSKFNEADSVEVQDPASTPIYWVSKWLDYSHKYGLAYQLCDDSVGTFFNDNTKLILDANGQQLQYIQKNSPEQYYEFGSLQCPPPASLEKKISLLRHFRAFMTDKLVKTGANIPKQGDELARLPCVQSWSRSKSVIVFFLSNGTFQINFIQDHSKLIMCPLMGAVTFIDSSTFVATYKFALLQKFGCPKELWIRLRYAKTIIERLLSAGHEQPANGANPNNNNNNKHLLVGDEKLQELVNA